MKENYLFIVILVVLVLLACIHFKKNNNESFVDMHPWGNVPPYSDPVSQQYNINPTTRNIVGPNPGKNYINNWQYNPQNTLLDYHYYRDNEDLKYLESKGNISPVGVADNRSTEQLAPVLNNQIGKTTYPDLVTVDQPNPLYSTRIPNSESTPEQIKFSENPESSSPFVGLETQYSYF